VPECGPESKTRWPTITWGSEIFKDNFSGVCVFVRIARLLKWAFFLVR